MRCFSAGRCARYPAPRPRRSTDRQSAIADGKVIRSVIEGAGNGYLPPDKVTLLLNAAGIETVPERVVSTSEDAVREAARMGFPVVMKVIGPLHKSDMGGVALNVSTSDGGEC